VFLGIDAGASATKAILLSDKLEILSHHLKESGVDFKRAALEARTGCLASCGIEPETVTRTLATGYGRRNVTFADSTKTEISCHARGAYFHHPGACTVVDIGGQDNKVIKIDADGRPLSFKMNRKCAAGTGAFLEETAARMALPVTELDRMARVAQSEIEPCLPRLRY
jgi:predicted CoA-substrate-specific enzyme activase